MQQLSPKDYARRFAPSTCFDSVDFAALNAHKVDGRVAYLADDGLGLILGRDNAGTWLAPWSAPYATASGQGDWANFASKLAKFTHGNAQFVLPSAIYGREDFTRALESRADGTVIDYNYHYELANFSNFSDGLSRASRKLWHQAMRAGFVLEKTDDVDAVYSLFTRHHQALGYRLAMSLEAVKSTARIIDIDFFVVRQQQTQAVAAAAMVYHSAPGIVQVILWCDALDMRHLRPMNFINWAVLDYYAADGTTRIVDLGPASVDGVKNQGLVNFKLGMGCIETPKLTVKGLKL